MPIANGPVGPMLRTMAVGTGPMPSGTARVAHNIFPRTIEMIFPGGGATTWRNLDEYVRDRFKLARVAARLADARDRGVLFRFEWPGDSLSYSAGLLEDAYRGQGAYETQRDNALDGAAYQFGALLAKVDRIAEKLGTAPAIMFGDAGALGAGMQAVADGLSLLRQQTSGVPMHQIVERTQRFRISNTAPLHGDVTIVIFGYEQREAR